MDKTCMKCGYVRRQDDEGPDHSCPKCGAVYAKVKIAQKRADEEQRREAAEKLEQEEKERQQRATAVIKEKKRQEKAEKDKKVKSAINEYVSSQQKSSVLAFLLALLLGPIGLLYASPMWGVIGTLVALVSAASIVGPVIIWMLSVLSAPFLVSKHRRKLRAEAKLLSIK